MNGLTRAMAAALRCLAALVPAGRREWAEAIRAEAAEVPAGRQRLNWLAGGVRLTVQEAARGRRSWYSLAFAAAAAGMAWNAWSGPPGDSAIEINRIDVIVIVVILAGLPWIVRRARGPVADARLARLVRTGGYVTVLALVVVKSAVERVADAPPNNLSGPAVAWTGEAVFLAVMASYAAVILVFSARRSPALPATVAFGTVAGIAVGLLVYVLGPLGFPLRFTGPWPARLYDAAMALGVLLALGAPAVAGRRAGRALPAGAGARQGAMAGLCFGTAAALVVAVLSTATIAILPYDAGFRHWAISHVGQWTPAVGQLTSILHPRLGYVAGNSAFAAGYLVVLLVSPLAGCAFGAWGAHPRPGSRGERRGGAHAPRCPRPPAARLDGQRGQ